MKALDAAKLVAREKYVWPGGYALFLVMANGDILCPKCVRAEYRNIVQYTQKWKQRDSGWCAEGYDHAGNADESTLICDHCGTVIHDGERW